MTVCHIRCTRRRNFKLPDDGQNMWPKHVGTVYNKYIIIVQLVSGEICVSGRCTTSNIYTPNNQSVFSSSVLTNMFNESTWKHPLCHGTPSSPFKSSWHCRIS